MTRPRALAAHLRAAGITAAVKGRVIVLQWGGVALTFTDEGEGTTIALAPELLKAEMTRRAVRLRLLLLHADELPAAAAQALAQAEPGQAENARAAIEAVVAECQQRAVDSATLHLRRKEEALAAVQRDLEVARAKLADAQGIKAAVLAALEPSA